MTTDDWRGVAADIERAATPKGRARTGCYSIEGLRLHERVLRAGVAVERALVGVSLRQDSSARVRAVLDELERCGCSVHTAPDEAVAGLTAGRDVGAILGLVRVPESPPLATLLASGRTRRVRLLVAVDVDDPGNVGALIRTALASGAAAFVRVGLGDPFHPKAVRTSMGSLFRLPLLRYRSMGPLLDELRKEGVRSLGAVAQGGTALPDADLGQARMALFVGSEAFGLPADVSGSLDERVTIPMGSKMDSYSVNAAAAILLYAMRQAG